LLKNLTIELRKEVGELESAVTHDEISISRRLIRKYFPFVPEYSTVMKKELTEKGIFQ